MSICKPHRCLTGLLQMYGVAEGKPLSELRAMAKAAGEECPMFTPPGGETVEQVHSPRTPKLPGRWPAWQRTCQCAGDLVTKF